MTILDIRKIPAVYINLEKHTEKNNSMYQLLSSIGFETIERVEGVLDTENSVAGCSKAHHKALSSFKTPFVLFEDDCVLSDGNLVTEIEIPDDADALYLGVSSWGRMNGHNGEYVQYDILDEYPGLLRVYNMLATHAILYISKEYAGIIKRAAYHTGYVIENYNDVSFAELQRYFNVYCFDYPIFAQSSNALGTTHKLTSLSMSECMSYNNLQFYPYPIK